MSTNLFANGDFMRRQFAELDRDGDGFITESDLMEYIKGHPVHACAINVSAIFMNLNKPSDRIIVLFPEVRSRRRS